MGIQINGTNDTITTNDGTISIDSSTTFTGSLTGTTGLFSGDVGVAGTLTSEDKENIDSVGLITARTGIKIGPITGVAGTFYADGSYRTAGIITANTYYGSGANLTGIDATKIITGNTQVQTVDTGSDGHVKVLTEGAERVRIDSSGNIGAGTNSPSSFSASDFVISKSANAGITISVGNAGTTNTASIFFAEGSGGTGDKERGAIKYKHGDDYLAFHTNYDERLRINSSGNVGLGTGNPTGAEIDVNARLLHIKKNTTSGALLKLESSNTIAHLLAGNNQFIVRTHTDDPIAFHVNGGEKLRFASSGQIGIAGANYGSSGQALLSGGSGATVTWGAPAAPSIGDSDNYPGSHICLGTNAGDYGGSNYKIAIGYQAGQYGTGRHNNIFIGVNAGRGNSDNTSSTGDSNTCVGNYAGEDLTSGSSNTLLGPNAGKDVTSGNSNVIIGYSAGSTANDLHGTVIIGPSSGYGLDESNYSVIIGHGASGESLQGDAADNQLYIARQGYGGGSQGTWIYGNSSGQCTQGGGSASWYTGSDERYKDFLGKYSRGLAEINGLDVQNFKWKEETDMPSIAFNNAGSYCGPEIDGKTKIGVGAQSCEALIPEAVNKLEPIDLDKGGNHMLTLDNDPIFWAAINAIQELSTKIDALTTRVSNLE